MDNPIGVATWIFGHHDYARIAARVTALGFAGIELFTDIGKQAPAHLRELLDHHGLAVLSMTPENVDIAHASRKRRDQAVGYYQRLVDFAADLGSSAITCHEYVGRTRPQDSPELERARLVESCTRVAQYAETRHIDVVLEPLNHRLVSAIHTGADALEVAHAVGSDRFRVVLDSFHMHAEEPSASNAIRACGNRLGLFQIADSNREGMGAGVIDFDSQLAALRDIDYQGALILECGGSLPGPSLRDRAIDGNALELQLSRSRVWIESRQGRSRNGW